MAMHVSSRIDPRRLLTAFLAATILAGAALGASAQQQEQPRRQQSPPQKPAAKPAPRQPVTKPAPTAKTEALPPSQIGTGTLARHAFMVDPLTSTVLLFKDADKPMAPSSMSKMMTIYILFEELTAGRIKLDTKFRVSERARAMGGSRMFVETGTEVSIEELIRGMIVLSGNDACVVVAEGLSSTDESFAERMTKRGRELGMVRTVFKNSSGWPAEGQQTTARDLAVLAAQTIEAFPSYYRYYAETEWSYNNIRQDNRNRLLRLVPGSDGLKTGHTEEGGYGQTVSAIRDGRRLVLVVNGLGSMAERATETARLMEWGFREFANTTIFRAGDVVTEAPVWLGAADRVPLVIGRVVALTSPVGQPAQPRIVARFEGPFTAPIGKGTKLGTLAVTLPDGRVSEHPLEAGLDVPRLGPFGRVASLLKHYLFGWLS